MAVPSVISNVCMSAVDSAAQVYILQWTADANASTYNVYASAISDPSVSTNMVNRSGITLPAYLVSFTELLPNMNYYYFVSGVDSTEQEGPKQSIGITNEPTNAFTEDPFTNFTDTWGDVVYADNADMGSYLDEIRRREKWMLQSDGQQCYLLKRKWQGDMHTASMVRGGGLVDIVPDIPTARTVRVVGAGNSTTDFSTYGEGVNFKSNSGTTMTTLSWISSASRPSDGNTYWTRYQDLQCECYEDEAGQGKAMCTTCYGTWVPGGYVPFKILVSFPPPDTTVSYYREGMRTTVIPSPWTTYEPKVASFDLIRNAKTGEVYEVVSVTPTLWRGLQTTQDMKLRLLQPNDVAYRFTISGWPTMGIAANP